MSPSERSTAPQREISIQITVPTTLEAGKFGQIARRAQRMLLERWFQCNQLDPNIVSLHDGAGINTLTAGLGMRISFSMRDEADVVFKAAMPLPEKDS